MFPTATADKLHGGYEYLKGKNNAIARWCAWDGAADWYYNIWGHVNTVYLLDSDYNITGSHTFSSLPCEASYNDGYYYVKTARDGIFKSADGLEWVQTDEKLPLYTPYYDLENASQWAISELEQALDIGIRLTNQGESYNFTHGISREAFCELASKLIDRVKPSDLIETGIKFDDTTNPTIEKLATLGIINGFGDGTFRPKEQLTREQAAVILQRITKYTCDKQYNYEEYYYNDYNIISDWAKDGVSFAYHFGIMNGTGDNMFSPKESYSREQSVVTLLRLYKAIEQ